MIKSIAFTVYPVTDVPRARKFYESVLGLKMGMNFNDVWVEYDIAGGTLAITNMMTGSKPGGTGAHISFEVDDIEASVKKLKAQNIPFVLELFDTPVCRMAAVADPDGNGIGLHQCKSAGA
jgi:predicted enzyme related to lactoylglutathione lyase